MRVQYRFILLMLILFQNIAACCQDVGFSQFYDQPLLRNPALAGIFTEDVRLTASYRNQWQSVTVPYRTFALSSEIKFPVNIRDYEMTLTAGLQLMRDVAGSSEFNTSQVLPAINLSLPVFAENSFLSLGFMGGLMQQRFDPTKLVLNDQFIQGSNGSFSILPYSNQVFNKTSADYFDLSTGLSYNGALNEGTDYYIGAGLFHLLNPSVGFFEGNKITLNKKLAFNMGVTSSVSDLDELTFYGDYFSQYGAHFQRAGNNTFQTGLLLTHNIFGSDDEDKTITAGALYRWDDAIIPVLQLKLSKFVIGASYDININKLVVASSNRGGFELTLSYRDLFKSRNPDLQGTKCPRFGHHRIRR